MSTARKCNDEDALLALAQERLPPAEAAEVEAHARTCAACGAELASLRRERALFRNRRRAAAASPPAWQAIESRLAVTPLRPAWRRNAGFVAAVAALAAGVVLAAGLRDHRGVTLSPTVPSIAVRSEAPAPAPAPEPRLDRAFADTDRAIATLERDYAARRPSLASERARRQDASLARLRHSVRQTRHAAASDDPRGRRAAFHATLGYTRSLRTALLEEQP